MANRKPPQRGAAAARQKAAAFQAAQRARQRRRRFLLWGGIVAAVVVIVGVSVGVDLASGSAKAPAAAHSGTSGTNPAPASSTAPPGPEGIPLEEGTYLASAAGSSQGQTVDGIECNPDEQVVYHIHTHLAVYVNGALRPIPPGIGIVTPVAQQTADGPFYSASRCYYWLHVHTQDGIIHIESPTKRTYTLGQFFAIWRQPLSSDAVGPAKGTVTTYVDGKLYTGDPAGISLAEHEDVQLDIGSPTVAPQSIDWSKAQL